MWCPDSAHGPEVLCVMSTQNALSGSAELRGALLVLDYMVKRRSAYLYCVRRGSSNISRIRTPSVQKRILVTPCMETLQLGTATECAGRSREVSTAHAALVHYSRRRAKRSPVVGDEEETGAHKKAVTASRKRNCQALLHESWARHTLLSRRTHRITCISPPVILLSARRPTVLEIPAGHAICPEEATYWGGHILKADAVADSLAQRAARLLCHAGSHSHHSYPPRLCACHHSPICQHPGGSAYLPV